MDSAGPEADAADADSAAGLKRWGGEFRSPALEAEFAADHADESFRHARLLLLGAAVLNALFLVSDWRFAGTPHFWVAIPARLALVLFALGALLLIARALTTQALHRIIFGWMIGCAAGVGLLVSSHTDLALFIVMLLPSIYYLVVPASFRAILVAGISCSIAMLVGYCRADDPVGGTIGLVIAMAMLNYSLTIVVTRSNRQARLTWLATRSERRMREALAASQSSLVKILETSPVPLVVWERESGDIRLSNSSWRAIMQGISPELRLESIRRRYVDPQDAIRLLEMIDRDGVVEDFEARVRTVDDQVRTMLMRCNTLDLPDGRMVVSALIDISERKEAEQLLAQLATTDALTGLLNRLAFFTLARQEVARLAGTGAGAALLMIDLDHFKALNDRHGHAAGDAALQGFATAAQRVLGAGAILGRIGGEEFAALLVDCSLAQALAKAEQLRAATEALRLQSHGAVLRISASVGVAELGEDRWNLSAALARADTALYAAKRAGRNRVTGENSAIDRLAS